MKNKIALIVGRFQPFHKGHLFLIKEALKKADKIVIGIGSANITDVNNPIDFETRKKIIKAVFYKEGIEEKLSKIVPLDDFFDDKKWLINLKKQVGKFDIALGNNDWTNNILEKAGYKVLKVNYYKRGMYEGWRIRKLLREGKKWQDRVPKYIVSWLHGFISENNGTMKQLNNVVLGGTFDHFHKGHKALLTKALEVGEKVTVGIATEKLYKNKFLSETVESFELRKKSVTQYLTRGRGVDIISFSDIYGTTLIESNIDAIIVSRETFPNALKINEERKKIHFKPLQIVIVEDVLAEDGKLISSERIRSGEIDREGKIYKIQSASRRTKSKIKEILMPEELRPTLQKPLGKIFKNETLLFQYIDILKHSMIITVGDIVTDSLLKGGIDPDVKVIDFRSRRKDYIRSDPFLNSIKKGQTLINKPGTINLKTAEALRQMIRKRSVGPYSSWLVVDGEEDLLTLPSILFAPLNSLVLYGHWQYGIISVTVDEEIKEKVREILKKFNIQ